MHFIPNNDYDLYVKVLTEDEWLGAWAPVRATLQWLRPDGRVGLFTLLDNDLEEDDEYAVFRPGTLVLARLVPEEGFRAEVWLDNERLAR